jgi:Short C-terminal domain
VTMEPPTLPPPPNPAQLRLAQMPKMKQLLDQSIDPGEKVEILIVGAHSQIVVGTDRRILVLKKGFMAGATLGHKLSSWEYRNVTGLQLDTRANSGILIVHAGGEEPIKSSYWATGKGSAAEAPNAITFASKPSAEAQAGVAQLRKRVAEAHAPQQSASAPDPVEQLRKLGELRDAGVISSEEFESKKRDLLDRI